ncbi:nuclear GTP-binding protein nug1 [Extremus antarcticus]|uniref:Nuclear GTP-binding protein nug1 n=1 Tax=Extremus antarcticus TaxID=702011 RepID=A0AAJ0DMH7_9PEZI|nr:nuclear GTP-binding protein nug1 [Extremus antarcticus]
MKVGKPKSKRVPVRLRERIQKSSASKQRKQRKDAKKNPQWVSRLKKDPGIPNSFPFKAQLLADLEENKRKKAEELQKRRDTAKAQRQGVAVVDQKAIAAAAEDEDDVLLDIEEDEEDVDVDAMEEEEEEEEEEDDDDDEEEEWDGIDDKMTRPAARQVTRNPLPKQALEDPVKAVSTLLDRMQKTTDGIQRLIDHYQIPPPMTASTNLTSGFLVEVARKRGRLGKGGIPNLHSAALTVLGDLNEGRLELPSVPTAKGTKAVDANGKGKVQVVTQMAEPFRIGGLWGGKSADGGVNVAEEMAVDA